LRLAVNAGRCSRTTTSAGSRISSSTWRSTDAALSGLEVVNFMQSLGMRFGAHVNANTSFDETIYELQIPTENPMVIDRALLALEDWAHNVTFDPTEIDKERGVILEEWRQASAPASGFRTSSFRCC
jgi:zinc protease